VSEVQGIPVIAFGNNKFALWDAELNSEARLTHVVFEKNVAAALVAVAEAARMWSEARFAMVPHANDGLVFALAMLDAAQGAA
jgi:hypothetical protein